MTPMQLLSVLLAIQVVAAFSTPGGVQVSARDRGLRRSTGVGLYMMRMGEGVGAGSMRALWRDYGLGERREVWAERVFLLRVDGEIAMALENDDRVDGVFEARGLHKWNGCGMSVKGNWGVARARLIRGRELSVLSESVYNARGEKAKDLVARWKRSEDMRDVAAYVVPGAGASRLVVLAVPAGVDLCQVAGRVAADHGVVGIERRLTYYARNNYASAAVQSGAAGPVSAENAVVWRQGIMGQGEVVGVGDSGIDMDSCYFRETQSTAPLLNGCDMSRRKVVCYFLNSHSDYGDDSSALGGGHGTHVSGAVGGMHVNAIPETGDSSETAFKHVIRDSSQANGIAPLVKIAFNDINGQGTGVVLPPMDLATSEYLIKPYDLAGARVHSNSWGCSESPGADRLCNMYDTQTRSMDEFIWNNQDTLLIVAAGNAGDIGEINGYYKDGYYTVGAPATLKNGLSVGATQREDRDQRCLAVNASSSSCSFDNLFAASSKGPTFDGRIKPDIVFPGERLASASSSGFADDFSEGRSCRDADVMDGIQVFSGTSMSCPGVAGTVALLRQYYRTINPSTGERGDTSNGPLGDGKGPSGALLKATLLNSARSLEGHYTYRPGPSAARVMGRISEAQDARYLEGFGMPVLNNVLLFANDALIRSTGLNKSLHVFDRHILEDGDQAHRFVFNVAAGGTLKATLVYTDPPGPVRQPYDTDSVLVNNLDVVASCIKLVSVEDESPEPCDISLETWKSESPIDNVEQLPPAGNEPITLGSESQVTVRIVPTAIVQHSQPYALVLSGSGLEFVVNRSTRSNWKPTWTEKAVAPLPSTTRTLIYAGAAVGAVLVLAFLLSIAGRVIRRRTLPGPMVLQQEQPET